MTKLVQFNKHFDEDLGGELIGSRKPKNQK